MVEVITFTDDDGEYARGFINQEGLHFYVLDKKAFQFYEKACRLIGIEYTSEEVKTLPG